MRNRPTAAISSHERSFPGAALVLALVLVAPPVAVSAAGHPTLPGETARCEACHDDLLSGGTVHAAAESDCSGCHEVSVSDTGTRVALADGEPALCLMCHDGLTAAVEGALERPHYPVTESCLTCHDPHSSDHPGLLVTPVSEVCSSCHDPADLARSHGEQLTRGTDCASCHEAHGSENERLLKGAKLHVPFAEGSCDGCHRAPFGDRIRLRVRGEKLCASCHGDLAEPADGKRSIHPALRGERGKAGCLSCHDPHMSDNERLLVESGVDLCRTCHAEIVGAAEAESGHAAAAMDCLACHEPHTSGEARLLGAPVDDLCQGCHDVDDPELGRKHLGADLAALECTTCHDPHGTGNDKLLARTLHPPVLDGCDTCHEGSFDKLMEDGESALCLVCHDDIGELAKNAAVPHAALELARCVDCHNPHASPQESLVKLPRGGVCTECHDDLEPGADESLHGAIAAIGCQGCHEPHGGSREKLLRKTGSDLCLSCHSPAAVRSADGGATLRLLDRFDVPAKKLGTMVNLRLSADGQRDHPVTGHRVLGTPTEKELKKADVTFREELTCLTCHDPHKGREKLLRWNAASPLEACIQCHPK